MRSIVVYVSVVSLIEGATPDDLGKEALHFTNLFNERLAYIREALGNGEQDSKCPLENPWEIELSGYGSVLTIDPQDLQGTTLDMKTYRLDDIMVKY